jgi:outer membrane lipoprotein-sorting protein
MNKNWLKLAAIAAAILIALILINQFTGSIDPATTAFAKIIENFKSTSYSFNLTYKAGNATGQTEIKLLQPGKIRAEYSVGLGKITSIIDLKKGKTLLIFHQFKNAQILENSDGPELDKAGGIVTFFSRPVENLWGLIDEDAEYLGEKQIENRTAIGFKTKASDDYFDYVYTIWADAETNEPISVNIDADPKPEDIDQNIEWTLTNFQFDIDLAPSLFELKIPQGYTLAYQKDLKDILDDTEKSDQAAKIEQALTLASQNKLDQAAKILLDIDFSKTITFPKQMYIFTLTEKEYVSLKQDDQKTVMEKAMLDLKHARNIAKHFKKMAEADPDKAQTFYEASIQFGKLLDNDQERLLITRLVGIAIEQLALKEVIPIYEKTGQSQRLTQARQQFESLENQKQQIKNKASGR